MNSSNTFLAVFIGSKSGPKWSAWNALSEGDRRAKEQSQSGAAQVHSHGMARAWVPIDDRTGDPDAQ